jgi:hypothetical protein
LRATMEKTMRPRKITGFNSSVIKAAGENWDDVRRFNRALLRLDKRRVRSIVVTGQYAVSKLAWKAAVLQQVLLYRCVGLGSGCAKMWNFGNVLCSVLAARALLETIALTLDFEANLQMNVAKKDFGKIDELVTLHTFSTRSERMLDDLPELKAENVLNYIDRLEKMMPGIRAHYEFLSEWCHPNSYGHYFTFASLDKASGTVSFSNQKLHGKDLLNAILAVYVTLGLVESAMERLDTLIRTIAKIHSEAHPVKAGNH